MEDVKLSRTAIIAEALALLNDVGLENFSLRPLAARLGIKAPSLYWYVQSKDALLSALIETVFTQCIDAVEDHHTAREWMRSFGRSLWDKQHEVRDFGRLITATDIGAEQLKRTDGIIQKKLQQLDMPIDEATQLQSSVQALMTGWSTFAHAPYADSLNTLVDFNQLAMRSLDALIDGWDSRASTKLD